jgi:hypothetical protein
VRPAELSEASQRAAYKALLDELRTAWDIVNSASLRLEHVGGPAVQNLLDLFFQLLERRYVRFAVVLPAGAVREETLANIARQLAELRAYMADFLRNLADRAARRPYADQARFAGERYVNLFIVHELRLRPSSRRKSVWLMWRPSGDAPRTAAPKVSRGILKPQSLSVAFTDPPVASRAAAAQQPPPAAPPGWPYYASDAQYPPQLGSPPAGSPMFFPAQTQLAGTAAP